MKLLLEIDTPLIKYKKVPIKVGTFLYLSYRNANDYLDMYKNDCLRVYIFAVLVYCNFIWSDGHDSLRWVTRP